MSQQFKLHDGRVIDFHIDGDTNGYPFIWLHGTPGSRLAVPPSLDELCKTKGLKIIALSRPGYGDSSRHEGRVVVDTVADVTALNEHLGIKDCVVGGWSGGGPHVLACAARLKGVKAALCVAGCAPYGKDDLDSGGPRSRQCVLRCQCMRRIGSNSHPDIDEFNATLAGAPALRKLLDSQRPGLLAADAAGLVQEMASILPEVDKKALLSDATLGQGVVEGIHEGLKHSTDGWFDDDMELMKPWGFEVEEVNVPTAVWQGSEDQMVPFAHGEWIVKHLPAQWCKAHLLQGEGHISVFIEHVGTMVEELLEGVKR
nr:hypothetical protein B0A51_03333 [Rachicladosporium sp. CCFEE 5018]